MPSMDRRTAAGNIASLGPSLPLSVTDSFRVGSRRWFLQTGLAGLAGLSLADALRAAASTSGEQSPQRDKKAVILFWLSGGPSHLDMWDPKPEAPAEIRGPYQTIATRVPGIRFCEHLPLQAEIADKLTILRSVDCSASNHTPITMQAGNSLARRTDDGRDGGGYPSMGSIASKFRGSNSPPMPAFVGLAPSWVADVWGAGQMGNHFEPVKGHELAGRLSLSADMDLDRLQDRRRLRRQFDKLQASIDARAAMAQTERYSALADKMMTSPRVREAFDLGREPDLHRDAYGRTDIGDLGLLARRLVEAGTTFVLVSARWGYFDNHGDNVPPWGGIAKGLTPILPTVDRVIYALVRDLADRGLLDSTLLLMMGEFGRTPVLSSDGGRGHWTNVMSMLMAGGGLRHGQAIGATDSRGGEIKERKVTPSDLAATVFRHLEIPLETHWENPQGRPIPIVVGEGAPIAELF